MNLLPRDVLTYLLSTVNSTLNLISLQRVNKKFHSIVSRNIFPCTTFMHEMDNTYSFGFSFYKYFIINSKNEYHKILTIYDFNGTYQTSFSLRNEGYSMIQDYGSPNRKKLLGRISYLCFMGINNKLQTFDFEEHKIYQYREYIECHTHTIHGEYIKNIYGDTFIKDYGCDVSGKYILHTKCINTSHKQNDMWDKYEIRLKTIDDNKIVKVLDLFSFKVTYLLSKSVNRISCYISNSLIACNFPKTIEIYTVKWMKVRVIEKTAEYTYDLEKTEHGFYIVKLEKSTRLISVELVEMK